MSTVRQKRVARGIVKATQTGYPKTKKEIAVLSGYSEIHAKTHTHEIFNAPGVQKELKALGFTEENAKSVVADIMMNEAEEGATRIRAASEVFKVHGTYAAEKSVNLSVSATADEARQAIIETMIKLRSGSVEP